MSLIPRRVRPASRPATRAQLTLELLEDRCTPAVQAVFDGGVLTVLGDAAANAIVLAADAAGNLQVTNNGVAVQITARSGQAVLAQTNQVVVEGRGGNDTLTTSSTLNTIGASGLERSPEVRMLGGAGDDTLNVLNGGIFHGLEGVDLSTGIVTGTVIGNAFMDGGIGNDTLTSGFGNDTMRGGDGNDSYLWPPGTLTDTWDGGAGFDTATIVGNDAFVIPGVVNINPAPDAFELSANGERVLFKRTNLVQFAVNIGSTESIVLRPGAGDDVVTIKDLTGVKSLLAVTVEAGDGNDTVDGSAQNNAFIVLNLKGEAGNDTLKGGAGLDLLNGGADNDNLNGGRLADLLIGGDGDDTLNGGEDRAPDVYVGGDGADTFQIQFPDVRLDVDPLEGDIAQRL
jgi:Ca2+-binding RTX toxin-like protein